MGKKEAEFKVMVDWPDALQHLRALLDSLEGGGAQLSQGERTLFLSTQGSSQVSMEIKAKDKGDKCKLSLELSWKQGAEPGVELQVGPLTGPGNGSESATSQEVIPAPPPPSESKPKKPAAAKPKAKSAPKTTTAKKSAKAAPKAAAKAPARKKSPAAGRSAKGRAK
jgi:amphi-Trp domain-containing protein